MSPAAMRRLVLAMLVACFGLLAGQGQAAAPEPGPPDRAQQLLEMQFNSRNTQPPPPPMSGREATRAYEGAFGSNSQQGGAAGAAPSAGATSQ